MTETTVCPSCARPNAADARFCSGCARGLQDTQPAMVEETASTIGPGLKCPWCGHSNAPGLQMCAACDRSLGGTVPLSTARQWAAASTTPPRTRKPFYKRWWFFAAIPLAALVAMGAWGNSMAGSDGNTPSDESVSAFNVCKNFVRDRLRAPTTATFRNVYQDDGEVTITTSAADGSYTVRSSVDAQNGFGAKIRNDFTCVVVPEGDRTWRLEDLRLTVR